MNEYIDIVFTDLPGPGSECVFVEVEDQSGKSIAIGTWTRRSDGFVALRIPDPRPEDQR